MQALKSLLLTALLGGAANASPYIVRAYDVSLGECPGATCHSQAYPAGNTIGSGRYITSPSGNVTLRIHVDTTGVGPTGWDPVVGRPISGGTSTYGITATARVVGANDDNGSQTVTGTSSKLWMHGTEGIDLDIPISGIDWAESIVNVNVVASEVFCPQQHMNAKTGELIPACTTYTDSSGGPDLSAIATTVPNSPSFTQTSFVLIVTPAAAFQAPVMPVGIVYAPLGNQGKASFAVTQTLAKNSTITMTNGTTMAQTDDDKTQLQFGFSIGQGGGGGNGGDSMLGAGYGFNYTGTWDETAEQDNADTYGETASVVTQDQISTTFGAPPSSVPLDQVSYWTQPFWNDLVLASINAQYALWDYPAGPVLQPLGSASIVALPIAQLDSCYRDTTSIAPVYQITRGSETWAAARTYAAGNLIVTAYPAHLMVAVTAGTSGAALPSWPAASTGEVHDGTVVWRNEDDHFVQYAGSIESGATKRLWLTSTDCVNIANLDAFYVAKSQTGHPAAYRTIAGGELQTLAPSVFSNTQTTSSTTGTTTTHSFTLKSSSAAVNSQSVDVGVTLLSLIGIKFDDLQSSTSTQVTTSVSSTQEQQSTTSTGTAVASTTIQDNSGLAVPVNIMQDSMFQGMAVQDTAMHLRDNVTLGGAQHLVVSNPSNLPIVAVGGQPPADRTPYIQLTNYGYVTVTPPSNALWLQNYGLVEAMSATAAHLHVPR